MSICTLRRSALSLLARRLSAPLGDGAAAAFATSAPPETKPDKKRDPADDFIFKASRCCAIWSRSGAPGRVFKGRRLVLTAVHRRRLQALLLTAAFATPPPSLLQEKCKGTRQVSKDAEEVKQR